MKLYGEWFNEMQEYIRNDISNLERDSVVSMNKHAFLKTLNLNV